MTAQTWTLCDSYVWKVETTPSGKSAELTQPHHHRQTNMQQCYKMSKVSAKTMSTDWKTVIMTIGVLFYLTSPTLHVHELGQFPHKCL